MKQDVFVNWGNNTSNAVFGEPEPVTSSLRDVVVMHCMLNLRTHPFNWFELNETNWNVYKCHFSAASNGCWEEDTARLSPPRLKERLKSKHIPETGDSEDDVKMVASSCHRYPNPSNRSLPQKPAFFRRALSHICCLTSTVNNSKASVDRPFREHMSPHLSHELQQNQKQSPRGCESVTTRC